MPTRLTFLPRTQQPTTTWKNGGGSTRVVAIDPPDAGVTTFRWRISIADVGQDGPFSAFPGIDRSLWLLAGKGMVLTLPDRELRLDQPGQRFDFAGELPITARLVAGPTQDLNLMVDRARLRTESRWQQLPAGGTHEVALARNGTCLVLALAGSMHATCAHASTELANGDALRLDDGPGTATLTAGPAGAVLLVAHFLPRIPDREQNG